MFFENGTICFAVCTTLTLTVCLGAFISCTNDE